MSDPEKNGSNGSKVSVAWLNSLLLYIVGALVLGGITMLLNTITAVDAKLESLDKAQMTEAWTVDTGLKQQAVVQNEWEKRYALLEAHYLELSTVLARIQSQVAENQRTLGIQQDWISATVHANRAKRIVEGGRSK